MKKIANFLNKSLTDSQVIKLTDFLKFSNRSKDDLMLSEEIKKFGFVNDKGIEDRGYFRQGNSITQLIFVGCFFFLSIII